MKVFILILLLPVLSFTQTLDKINIGGNVFSNNDYLAWSGVGPGMKTYAAILDTVKKNISDNLAQMGYYHPVFDNDYVKSASDPQKVMLSLFVHEGNPTYVHNIMVEDPGTDSLYFTRLFGFMNGQVFVKSELEDHISVALNYLEENGLPFARIIIGSVYFFRDTVSQTDQADIYIKIDKGTVSRIDKIEVKGNTKTNESVIIRELGVRNGDLYSQSIIDEIPKRLNRLRFFEPVSLPSYYLNSKNQGVLSVEVKEKETNNFDGIIGYLPGVKEGDKGYLTGLVNVTLRNLLGTGRGAALRWQQIDRYSQELELRYLEPWVLNYPFNINLGLLQQKQDTTYVQRKYEGSVEYMATENISASFVLSSESVIPTDNGTNLFSVYNSSILTTGVTLKIDTRDDIYAPRSGLFFNNSYLFSRKKINGPQRYLTEDLLKDINQQRFAVDFGLFYEPFDRQVAALSLHGRELRGGSVEVSDLYRFGGTNTLRGYRENQFLANRLLWSNLEYRFLLSRRTYGFIFLDSGYYLRNEDPVMNISRSSAFRTGYGLGMNIETGLGVLSVSYALAKGDSFSQGKIHFGLVNEF
ncbi:MAG: outer membrane protein assembly factor [Ignavibacteriales bacterium]